LGRESKAKQGAAEQIKEGGHEASKQRLYEGVLLEQLEDVLLVVEPGDVDGRLPVQVLQRPAMQRHDMGNPSSFIQVRSVS